MLLLYRFLSCSSLLSYKTRRWRVVFGLGILPSGLGKFCVRYSMGYTPQGIRMGMLAARTHILTKPRLMIDNFLMS